MNEKIYDNIEVNTERQGRYYKMPKTHFHQIYEIYYLTAGERKFFIESEMYHITKGTLVLLDRYVMHKTEYDSEKLGERTCVLFSDKYMSKVKEECGEEAVESCFKKKIFPIPLNRRDYVESILKRLENEYENSDEFSLRLIQMYLQEIFIFLVRYNKIMGAYDSSIPKAGDEIIQSTARHIAENYNRDITLSNAAEFAGMSSTYFSKKFKEVTGFGFKEYVLNIRIKKACALLLETRLSITEIAYETGFNDSNYFGDVFKRMRGMSPLKYRKNRGLV